MKDLIFGNFVINGVSGVTSEKLTDLVGDILEQNSDVLEAASKVISGIENFIMGCTDKVDNIPVVNNLAKAGLESFKTFGTATSYPVNVFNEVGKNVFNKDNYKEIENPLDVAENISKGAVIAVESVVKASVNTVKDVSYGISDVLTKLKWW